MNDDTDKPLNPVGDAALEARITAWVLGEASPFEAAELEEICARDPEARLFERRLRVLHGFIVENRKVGPDDEWKLPAEKRAKIEALFDEPVVLGDEDREPEKVGIRYVRKPGPPRQTGRRALLALAACTVISAAGWMLFSSVGESSRDVVALQAEANVSPKAIREAKERSLEELRKAIIVQEDAVEDKRKLLSEIERTESIAREFSKADNALSVTEAHAEVAKEKANLESQLAVLDHATATPQLSYGSGWVMPDEALAGKVPQLQEEKRQFEALRSQGLAENHPEVKAKAAKLEGLEKDVKGAVARVREDLNAKLALSNEQLARLDSRLKEREADAVKQGIANQTYHDPKNDLETSQRLLEQLKAKLISEEMQMRISEDATALASADQVEFLPGGGSGGGSGGGVGMGSARSANADMAQASPAAPGQSMGGLAAAPAEPSAPAVDTLAAVERKAGRGQAMDESLAKLADEPAARPKSSASGPPAKKSAAPAAANGAIASEEFADREAFGNNLAFGRDSKPAEMEADTSDRFAMRLGTAPANSTYDLKARFSGETPMPGYRWSDQSTASAFGDVSADPFASGGTIDGPGQSRMNADFIAEIAGITIPGIPADPSADVSDVMTAGNRSGVGAVNRNSIDAILKNTDRPVDAAGAADVLADIESAQLQGGLKDPAKPSEMAETKGDRGLNEGSPFAGKSIDPALAQQHEQNTGEVRLKLSTAEGNYNLGKFDDAHKAYEDALRLDPYNKAARRGMEQVAQARGDYYRAAYDQTRAQLLTEVDGASELAVPPMEENGLKDLKELDGAPLDQTRAELLAEVDKAWELAVPPVDAEPTLADLAKKKQEEKPPVVVELVAETLTSAEPFSTFSLHVSDASFKLAKAALDRGEVPAADGIRPEEFYNAFDYGDAAPANGEPVVCAVEQSAHPALPQRNLLRIGVKTGSQGRGGSTPLNLTLLLDSSGSMEREDRNAGLANAVRQLSGLLKEGDTVSVIGFARQPRLLVDRLPGNRAQELNAIFAQTPSEGGTNLEEGLKLGEQLALRQFNAAAQNRIVLFTDGAANLGDAKPETLQAKVEEMRQMGIAFDAAGFGTDGLNDKLLEQLTRNGNGRYYIVDRAEDADANFANQLAGAFRPAAENVKVQVRFNPARVAKYKLIGFEEHRLKKEDFRNDAVDAAEMAAEEAGNALYQIEPLPQGEGEVGEVSVRFRDVASGQMVERTWTIPYEAQASAFDQATPSIQLAGLAAFAAEKLRGTPMADAVDFQQLAPVMAKVKARYANSKPVAELESMLGKLK